MLYQKSKRPAISKRFWEYRGCDIKKRGGEFWVFPPLSGLLDFDIGLLGTLDEAKLFIDACYA